MKVVAGTVDASGDSVRSMTSVAGVAVRLRRMARRKWHMVVVGLEVVGRGNGRGVKEDRCFLTPKSVAKFFLSRKRKRGCFKPYQVGVSPGRHLSMS